MIPLKVKIVGFEQVRAKIAHLKNVVNGGTYEGINKGLETLKTNANEVLANTINGGNSPTRPAESIFNNWKIEKAKAEGGSIQGILGNTSEHAAMVEFGTGIFKTQVPYGAGSPGGKISSHGSWPLRFAGRDGQDTYRWSVKGQPPMRYLTGGIDVSKDAIQRDIQMMIKNKIVGSF